MKSFLKLCLCVTALMIGVCCANVSAAFENSVTPGISVYNSRGNEVRDVSKLTAGDYQVSVSASNADNEGKEVNIYLAVKINDRLYSLKDGGVSLSGRDDDIDGSAARKFFDITIPEGTSAGTAVIEAYYWNDTMKPFSAKYVFGGENISGTYRVKGRITGTHRSDAALGKNEVRFNVEVSDNFDGLKYGIGEMSPVMLRMTYEYADARKLMFIYCDAEIAKDENEEYKIVSLMPCTDTYYDVDPDLLDSYDDYSISFYESETSEQSVQYRLSSYAEMYVNGVMIGSVSAQNIDQYIAQNRSGSVRLIDATDEGTAAGDGKIDYIFVDYYSDAVVDFTSETSSGSFNIYWKECAPDIKTFKIYPDDEDIEYNFIKDGRKISYTEIKENDVLSIAYDVWGEFTYSAFYDVYVSDKTVTGKVTGGGVNDSERYYIINDVKYTVSGSYGAVLSIGTNYTVYLNVFDEISYFQPVSASAKSEFDDSTGFYVYAKSGTEYDEISDTLVDTIIVYGPDSDEPVSFRVGDEFCCTYEEYVSGTRGSAVVRSVNVPELKAGDVIAMTAGADGYVNDVRVLFNGIDSDYGTFLSNAVRAEQTGFGEPLFTYNVYPPAEWLNVSSEEYYNIPGIIFGPVMEKNISEVEIGIIEKNEPGYCVDESRMQYVGIESDANIYVYDFSEIRPDNRLYKGARGNVMKTHVPNTWKDGSFSILADEYGENTDFDVNFIVAKAADGFITDALVILGCTY